MTWLQLDAYKTVNTSHIVLLDISPVRDSAMILLVTGDRLEFADQAVVATLRTWRDDHTRPPAGKLGDVATRASADLADVKERLRCHAENGSGERAL